MSRFANMFSNNKDNEGFQVYSRRRPNNYSGYREPIQVKKEEKLITEENFPSLSTNPIIQKQPVLNYLENPKVISKEEYKKEEVVVEEKKEEKEEVLFTHQEAQSVFVKMVKNWENYENNYIREYGESEYLKQYGNYIHSYDLSDTEPETDSDTEYEEW